MPVPAAAHTEATVSGVVNPLLSQGPCRDASGSQADFLGSTLPIGASPPEASPRRLPAVRSRHALASGRSFGGSSKVAPFTETLEATAPSVGGISAGEAVPLRTSPQPASVEMQQTTQVRDPNPKPEKSFAVQYPAEQEPTGIILAASPEPSESEEPAMIALTDAALAGVAAASTVSPKATSAPGTGRRTMRKASSKKRLPGDGATQSPVADRLSPPGQLRRGAVAPSEVAVGVDATASLLPDSTASAEHLDALTSQKRQLSATSAARTKNAKPRLRTPGSLSPSHSAGIVVDNAGAGDSLSPMIAASLPPTDAGSGSGRRLRAQAVPDAAGSPLGPSPGNHTARGAETSPAKASTSATAPVDALSSPSSVIYGKVATPTSPSSPAARRWGISSHRIAPDPFPSSPRYDAPLQSVNRTDPSVADVIFVAGASDDDMPTAPDSELLRSPGHRAGVVPSPASTLQSGTDDQHSAQYTSTAYVVSSPNQGRVGRAAEPSASPTRSRGANTVAEAWIWGAGSAPGTGSSPLLRGPGGSSGGVAGRGVRAASPPASSAAALPLQFTSEQQLVPSREEASRSPPPPARDVVRRARSPPPAEVEAARAAHMADLIRIQSFSALTASSGGWLNSAQPTRPQPALRGTLHAPTRSAGALLPQQKRTLLSQASEPAPTSPPPGAAAAVPGLVDDRAESLESSPSHVRAWDPATAMTGARSGGALADLKHQPSVAAQQSRAAAGLLQDAAAQSNDVTSPMIDDGRVAWAPRPGHVAIQVQPLVAATAQQQPQQRQVLPVRAVVTARPHGEVTSVDELPALRGLHRASGASGLSARAAAAAAAYAAGPPGTARSPAYATRAPETARAPALLSINELVNTLHGGSGGITSRQARSPSPTFANRLEPPPRSSRAQSRDSGRRRGGVGRASGAISARPATSPAAPAFEVLDDELLASSDTDGHDGMVAALASVSLAQRSRVGGLRSTHSPRQAHVSSAHPVLLPAATEESAGVDDVRSRALGRPGITAQRAHTAAAGAGRRRQEATSAFPTGSAVNVIGSPVLGPSHLRVARPVAWHDDGSPSVAGAVSAWGGASQRRLEHGPGIFADVSDSDDVTTWRRPS